jgi:hypothetical protein
VQTYPRNRDFRRLCFVYVFCCLATSSINAEEPVRIVRTSPTLFRPSPILGTAKIPEGVQLGIACELDGKLLTGDWKLSGTIRTIDHEQGMIEFNTKAAKGVGTAHLAYRLPHQLKLALIQGDPITVFHDAEIHISSAKTLVLATSHRHDDTPPQSSNRAEILFDDTPGGHVFFYWANPDDETTQDLKTGSPPNIPISLKARTQGEAREIPVKDNAIIPVELDGQPYVFATVFSEPHSIEEVHGAAHKGTASRNLKCLLIRQTATNPR